MDIRMYDPLGLAGLGWFIDTSIGTTKTPEGHEILTRQAARGIISGADLFALVDGGRRPDLADPSEHIKLGEQNRHFLRSMNQPAWSAWFSAIDHLRLLHQNMLASISRTDELRLIGEALHLIQDSFAPAHVEREPPTREGGGQEGPARTYELAEGSVELPVRRFRRDSCTDPKAEGDQ